MEPLQSSMPAWLSSSPFPPFWPHTASVFQCVPVSHIEPEAHSNWCALHLVSSAAAGSQSTLASRKESSQVHITHPSFRQYNPSSTFSNMKPPRHPFMVFLTLDRFLYVRIFESGCLNDRRDRGPTPESESKFLGVRWRVSGTERERRRYCGA